MNCGNLLPVAKALRQKWSEREITIAADNDAFTVGKDGKPKNPGIQAARQTAMAVGAKLAVPRFKSTDGKPTDFNDLHQLEGLKTVKEQVENASQPTETDERAYDRLAKLSLADYDRARESEAKRLKIRTQTLDAEVNKRRPQLGDNMQGSAVRLPDVDPWPDPVDGAETLNAVAMVCTRYLKLPPGAADTQALWAAHTHAFEAFTHTPRLNFCSPDKGCGKTTALDVMATMTSRPLRTESISAAVLFRLVDAQNPTLLLDEVDSYLNEAEELRGLLNAGHKRGAQALRCEGESNTVRGFKAFAAAALAGIGNLPGTLHDRSIKIRLVRAKPGEVPDRFDSRHTEVEGVLCRKLARWATDNFAKLEACDPKLPAGAFNRLADNWRPLFAIAEVAGADWPARAAAAFAALTATEDSDAQGVGTTLLTDIDAIFANEATDRLPSAKLAEALAAMEGRAWPEFGKTAKPITPNQLARQLKKFSIAPRTIKLSAGQTAKGYHLADFKEAFERFLPHLPVSSRNSVTTLGNTDDSAISEPSPAESGLRPEDAILANKNGAGYGVTVEKAGEADKEPEPAGADLI